MKPTAHRRLIFLGIVLWSLLSSGDTTAQTLADDPAFALYRQAVEAFDRKEYDRAESFAQEAIKHYPEHLLAHYLLGQAAVAQAKWDEAAQAFSKVVAFYPQSFAGHRELGIALAKLERVEEAIEAFQAAVKLRPENEEIQLPLASLYLQSGERDQAFPLLKNLADRRTKEPDVWYALGSFYYERKDFTASEKALSQAAALRDDPKTWFSLGTVRLALEDYHGALKAFERAERDAQFRDEASQQIRRIYDHLSVLSPPRRGMEPSGRR